MALMRDILGNMSNFKKANLISAVIVGTKKSSDHGSIIENDVSILSKKQKNKY